MATEPARTRTLSTRRVVPLLIAAACLPLTGLLPPIDLSGVIGRSIWMLTATGNKFGAPVVLVLFVLIVTSSPVLAGRRLKAAATLTGVAIVLLGSSYGLNEILVKPAVAKPRPSIRELDRLGVIDAGEFYATPDRESRERLLREALAGNPDRAPRLGDAVRRHWEHATSFSFPSSHALATMMLASMFFCTFTQLDDHVRRKLLPWLVLSWAVMVCASRTLLRVHDWIDVSCGGLEGLCWGLAAAWITGRLLGLETGRRHAVDRLSGGC